MCRINFFVGGEAGTSLICQGAHDRYRIEFICVCTSASRLASRGAGLLVENNEIFGYGRFEI